MSTKIQKLKNIWRREAGEASMMTVTMYMILFAATAVGFTYIVAQNYRRVTNTTLQNQAKEAANSGVEDAKRLLVKCYSSGDNAPKYCSLLKEPIENQNCTSLLSSSNKNSLMNDLQIDTEDNGDGSFRTKVGDTSSNNAENLEYYQCLKASIMTKDLEYSIPAESSIVIPIKLNKNATGFSIEWHNTSISVNGDNPVSNDLEHTWKGKSTSIPSKSQWIYADRNWPAILRLEVASYPKNNSFSINDLVNSDTAVTFRPYIIDNRAVGVESGRTGGVSLAYHHIKTRAAPNDDSHGSPLIKADCKPGRERAYSCKMWVNYPDYTDQQAPGTAKYFLSSRNYFLRISAIYRSTHVKITIPDSDEDKDTYFEGVEPEVEATGRSADSYTRVRSRLKPVYTNGDNDDTWYPQYTVDTNDKVCKKMNVYYRNGEDFCD